MNDEEYLASAGINAETGDKLGSAPSESAPSSTGSEGSSATPAPRGSQPTDSKPVEMFELNGNQFPVSTEFQLNHGGKVLKVPYQTMANTYRQFAHFQDKMKAFNDEKTKFTEQYKDHDKYKGFYDQWGQFQEWSLQNPKDAETLLGLYKNKSQHLMQNQIQGGQPTPDQAPSNVNLEPLLQKISAYEEKFGKYDQVLSKYEKAEQTRQQNEDVDSVKKEIFDFQKEYPEINLDERDPDGVSLWAKIVQHGLNEGFKDFKPAALMFLNERVRDTIASRARAEALKTIKTDHQNGVVKRSATPMNIGQGSGAQPNKNVRNMSYGEIADMAKSQLQSN